MQDTVTLTHTPIKFDNSKNEVIFQNSVYHSWGNLTGKTVVPLSDCWKDIVEYHPRFFEYISKSKGFTPQDFVMELLIAEDKSKSFLRGLIKELGEDT